MAVCVDAPCCGCCGQIAWAREAEAEAEAYMDWADRLYDDFGPEPEPDEVECQTCDDCYAPAGGPCPSCGEVVDA